MTTSNFISLVRKMSKILPSCRAPEKNQPTAVPSSSASISSTTKKTFNICHTENKRQPPSNRPSPLFSPLSSLSSISSSTSSSIKDFTDMNSSSPPIFPWMMTPLPGTAWVFRTGFTPQPDSSAISSLNWCHHCDMHIQGTVDHRCEWCNTVFLPEPSSSPIPPPPMKKSKWSRSLGRFFSH